MNKMAVSAMREAAKNQPVIHSSFERETSTWQYVVADPTTSAAVIIDSVLDFNPTTLQLSTSSADALLALVDKHNYRVEMILETHAHADHITAAAYLQSKLAKTQSLMPKIGIGRRIRQVQKFFGDRYQIPPSDYEHAFDHLFEDNERFQLGSLQVEVLHLPGHTPDHVGYLIGGE
jgi:glyoxylase-like metal-dependent hydrolase (beta-lactamase superfamily II)